MNTAVTSQRESVHRAALVFAGCFAGALVSTFARFPGIGSAVLFLPYAVLTAALLAEEPRRFWLLLLASAAGSFLPHLYTGPTPFVLLAELANFTRALLVVLAVRCFSPPQSGLNSLRGMFVFLIAAVGVAPAVAALIGAAIVVWFRGLDFWLTWRTWFFSNALTGISLLPLLWVLATRRAFAMPSLRRALEACILSVSVVAIGVLVFLVAPPGEGLLPASLYWPMPFLLWAAVRFGPGGISLALLCVAMLTIWGASAGHGPFAGDEPTESLLGAQLFLLVVALPLLLLSALIEQQRRTAAELSSSRARYQSVVEDQTEMICRFSPGGTYTFANRAFRQFVSGSVDAPLPESAFSFVPQTSLAAISRQRSVADRETERLTADGQPTWQRWRDRGLYDEHGILIEYQCVGRDVSAERQGEQSERRLLAHREVERVLREGERKKDEFIAMLGHELRNPLAPMGAALNLLASMPGSEHSARAREVLGRQLGQLKRLVDDLLDVARISRGDIRVKLEPLDATELVEHALEAARPLIESCRHELVVSMPEGPVPILADRVRLVQALVNLLNNAAKYTEDEGRISLSLRAESGAAVITVEDTGVGISEEMLERVFELFVRDPSGPQRLREGLGIGLGLARRLVEQHGGNIVASSAGPGQGSRFVVRVPLISETELTSAVRRAPKTLHQVDPLHILVVDDNVDAADTLAEVLTQWGHQVRTVYGGDAALVTARQHRPDVVLSDIELPDMGGLELARRLRGDLQPARQLLVAITGFGQARDETSSLEAGFDHHLVKPIDFERLAALLDVQRKSKVPPPLGGDDPSFDA